MARVGRRFRVTGRVQGVFFRAWTRQQAEELGVTGWVRNAADGSVEGLFIGGEEVVGQLVERLHQGPPSALVNNVEISVAEVEALDSFEVRS